MKMNTILKLLIILSMSVSVLPMRAVGASQLYSDSPSGSITVHKFNDLNRDGVQEDGEPNIENWLMRLYIWTAEGMAVYAEGYTGPDGVVVFSNLPAQRYKVWEELPECWKPTTPGNAWNGGYYTVVTLEEAQQTEVAFGNIYVCEPEPEASIDVEKQVSVDDQLTWLDADVPVGPEVVAGSDTVWFRFLVTNTGDYPLTNLTLLDTDFETEISEQCAVPNDLAIGASYTCLIGPFTAVEGQHVNTATVTGDYGYGCDEKTVESLSPQSVDCDCNTVTDEDDAHYFGLQAQLASLEKSINGEPADTLDDAVLVNPGDELSFRYLVTNEGGVPLEWLQLTDSVFGDLATECGLPVTVAVGESAECEILRTAGDYPQGRQNIGTAVVYGLDALTDPAWYITPEQGAATFEKSINGNPADTLAQAVLVSPGDELTFRYEVMNQGNIPLNWITLTDDVFGDLTAECGLPLAVAVGESTACEITRVAGDYPEGRQNVGTALLTELGDYIDAAWYTTVENPAIDLEKHTNGVDADLLTESPYIPIGAPVLWEYIVTNVGNVPLEDVVVTDDQIPGEICVIPVLSPGEIVTCTASGVAVADQYTNLGVVQALYKGTELSDYDSSHYFGASPVIDLEKLTNGQDADAAPGPILAVGAPVVWTYQIRNNGNVMMTDIEVEDSDLGQVCTIAALAPGELVACTLEGVATDGQYMNIGTVTGFYNGIEVTDVDFSHYLGLRPGIDIEKHTNGIDADRAPGPYIPVGQSVRWDYLVRNTGGVILTDIVVEDNQGVAVSCPSSTLEPLASMTCTANGTAERGPYENIATVTGTPPVGDAIVDSDASHYYGVQPALQIETFTNGEDADVVPGPYILVDDIVNWDYLVSNVGDVSLTNILVFDDQIGSVCVIGYLAAGDSAFCTAMGQALPGQYGNTGMATATYSGIPVSAMDPSHYFGADPGIDLEKHTNDQDADTPTGPEIFVGAPVLWEYVVSNVGNVPLTGVMVMDDDTDIVVICPQTTLAVAEEMVCTANGLAVEGQYANLGQVVATAPIGPPVTDADASHYFGVYPPLDLEKRIAAGTSVEYFEDANTIEDALYAVAGDRITYQFIIRNEGDVPITNLTLTDNIYDLSDRELGDCQIEPDYVLLPDYEYICEIGFDKPIIAASGYHTNTATASGSYGGQMYTDVDNAVYYGSPILRSAPESNEADWDGSALQFLRPSLVPEGQDKVAVEVYNAGAAMQGPSIWELRWRKVGSTSDGVVVASGTIPALGAEQTVVLSYVPGQVSSLTRGNYRFSIRQRPGYPGSQRLWSE